mmetsp:Transcript_114815/g.325205  ORF Transcript_114815/g.325205 Transcript_114815/m.325205 type:complete len:472 (+) Transcript_114815:72-1487(+)
MPFFAGLLDLSTSFLATSGSHANPGAHGGEGGHVGLPAVGDELQKLSGGAVHVDLLNNNNSQYYGDFTLGKPGQHFTAVFDTGSGTTWIPGVHCKSDACAEHNRFAVDRSGSFVDDSKAPPGSIHYGTGEVDYENGRDTITFCDRRDNVGCHGDGSHQLPVPNQPFGMSTAQTSYPFRILPFDGILGLAPSTNPGSVLHQLKSAGSLLRNVFGVYLSEDTHRSGSIDFGGVEPSYIAPSSPLHWHKILGRGEWQVAMKDIVVDGKPLHICDGRKDGICPAVVDTGSSLVTGPKNEIEKLLPKIHTSEDCSNMSKMPVVSVQLVDQNGQVVSYPLTPKEYTLSSLEEVPGSGNSGYFNEFPLLGTKKATVPEIHSRCEPGIGVMDVPGKKWVLGDTFLRRYYSIYDDDRGMVGFARSLHPDEAAPAPAAATALPVTQKAVMAAAPSLIVPLFSGYQPSVRPPRGRSSWARFL